MSIRLLITLLMIGAGIGIMYLLAEPFGGLMAVTIGLLFFLLSLSIWTLPASSFERGHRLDPMQKRIIFTFLGITLGMLGGLVVFALIPPPYSWVIMGIVAIVVVVWWFRRP